MHRGFEGLIQIEEPPGALFVVDTMHEHIAVAEAKKVGIPTIAIVDTNSDPTIVDCAILCNDDSVKAIRMVFGLFLEGIEEGIKIRRERKSSKAKLFSTSDLVKIVPEVAMSQGIVDEISTNASGNISEVKQKDAQTKKS
jgi:small subunit ribosomal protein S2